MAVIKPGRLFTKASHWRQLWEPRGSFLKVTHTKRLWSAKAHCADGDAKCLIGDLSD